MSEIADEGAAAKNGSGGGGGRRVMGGIGCVGGDAWLRRRGSGRGGRGGGQEREAEEERKGMVEGSRLCRGSSAAQIGVVDDAAGAREQIKIPSFSVLCFPWKWSV